jgi:hypothetical protein
VEVKTAMKTAYRKTKFLDDTIYAVSSFLFQKIYQRGATECIGVPTAEAVPPVNF